MTAIVWYIRTSVVTIIFTEWLVLNIPHKDMRLNSMPLTVCISGILALWWPALPVIVSVSERLLIAWTQKYYLGVFFLLFDTIVECLVYFYYVSNTPPTIAPEKPGKMVHPGINLPCRHYLVENICRIIRACFHFRQIIKKRLSFFIWTIPNISVDKLLELPRLHRVRQFAAGYSLHEKNILCTQGCIFFKWLKLPQPHIKKLLALISLSTRFTYIFFVPNPPYPTPTKNVYFVEYTPLFAFLWSKVWCVCIVSYLHILLSALLDMVTTPPPPPLLPPLLLLILL